MISGACSSSKRHENLTYCLRCIKTRFIIGAITLCSLLCFLFPSHFVWLFTVLGFLWFLQVTFTNSRVFLNACSYEERSATLRNIVVQHKQQTTFEDFTSKVFAPVLPQSTSPSILVALQSLHWSKRCLQFFQLEILRLRRFPTPPCTNCPTDWPREVQRVGAVRVLTRARRQLPPRPRVSCANCSHNIPSQHLYSQSKNTLLEISTNT